MAVTEHDHHHSADAAPARGRTAAAPPGAAGRLGDPRLGQIVCLTGLLTIGCVVFDFNVSPWAPPTVLATALAAQAAFCRGLGLVFDPISPTITALSLSILLRADALWIMALAAALAISSKFLLRAGGRHLVNPAAFALFAAPLMLEGAWVSPGQWGSEGLLAVAVAAAGAAVASRAARLDTSLAFLAAWAALSFGRAAWLGDPLAIPLHQMQSGALLVFAFFMISDPATTPRARGARLVHAALVAALGFALQTLWITDTGAIWALALLAPLPLALDRLSAFAAPRAAVRRVFWRREA